MDLSFANQSLASEYLITNASNLEKMVYDVPEKIDRYIAKLKLESMKIGIDKLTEEQVRYLNSWTQGT
jgi:adenosylhomocysteinase